ncbi:MAG: CoA-binding protein [Promethearchaeati archaeon SRVP18_Atabeyarchaeia-1]
MAKLAIDRLDALFNPRSIALIGASNNPLKWGFIIPTNIITGQYKGELFLVNPKEKTILARQSYPNLAAIPRDIDLAIIATPSGTVPSVMEECIEKRIKASIVITAGYSETGEEGAKLEREVVNIATRGGITVVGPNTMGVYSASTSLYALMPPVRPKPGAVALVSQSGNLGTQLLDMGEPAGIGFTKFVSSGNEAQTTTEDYLEYFGRDPETKVILAYIEGLKGIEGGRRFMEVAREITKRKPIIVYKAGRSQSGARAAKSHSGAIAGSEQIYEAAFKQLGVIQASTIGQLLDLARGFEGSPLPRGRRVLIETWGGGYGVVTADACEEDGLEVAKLSPNLVAELDKILPPYWSKGNPVDLVGTLNRDAHLKCLELLAKSSDGDATIALGVIAGASRFVELILQSGSLPDIKGGEEFAQMFKKGDEDSVNEISKLVAKYGKPIVAVTLTSGGGGITEELKQWKNILVYPTPEKATKVLSKLYEYQRYLDTETQRKGKNAKSRGHARLSPSEASRRKPSQNQEI